MNALLNLTLADMLRECEALGIDTITHSETIQDMYEDGFDSYEVFEMVDVIENRDHYAYIPSL